MVANEVHEVMGCLGMPAAPFDWTRRTSGMVDWEKKESLFFGKKKNRMFSHI